MFFARQPNNRTRSLYASVLKKQRVLIISLNKVCSLNKLLNSEGNITANRFVLKLRILSFFIRNMTPLLMFANMDNLNIK